MLQHRQLQPAPLLSREQWRRFADAKLLARSLTLCGCAMALVQPTLLTFLWIQRCLFGEKGSIGKGHTSCLQWTARLANFNSLVALSTFGVRLSNRTTAQMIRRPAHPVRRLWILSIKKIYQMTLHEEAQEMRIFTKETDPFRKANVPSPEARLPFVRVTSPFLKVLETLELQLRFLHMFPTRTTTSSADFSQTSQQTWTLSRSSWPRRKPETDKLRSNSVRRASSQLLGSVRLLS